MSEIETTTRQQMYRDPAWLRREYHDNSRSLADLADECNVCKKTIWRALKRHDIDRRDPPGANNIGAKYRDEDWLRREYIDHQRSTYVIAEECNVSPSTIQRWLSVYNIPIRDPPREREDGVCCYITDNNYHLVCIGDKTVSIHQLVALLKGTPASLVFGNGGATVACHHANGCPLDNRLSNVQPMDWAAHSAFHRRDEMTAESELTEADVNAHCPLPSRD